jgi:hypothetical protein
LKASSAGIPTACLATTRCSARFGLRALPLGLGGEVGGFAGIQFWVSWW